MYTGYIPSRVLRSLAQQTLSFYEHRELSQIAAISPHISSGTCFGDSGGPLACNQTGQWRLVGLLSYVITPENTEHCSGLVPEVYSRVEFYTNFFEGNGNYVDLSTGVIV